jgi:hypothetical protein
VSLNVHSKLNLHNLLIMKKQILNIGKALSRAEQKQVFGGLVLLGKCWVSCKNGGTYEALDCDGWADGMCQPHGGFSSCSCW